MTSAHGVVFQLRGREKLINKNTHFSFIPRNVSKMAKHDHHRPPPPPAKIKFRLTVVISLTHAVASKYEWKKDARYSWNILLWLGSSGLTTSQNLSVLFCRAGRYFKSRIKHAGLWHGLPLNLISVGCFMACCTCFGLWLRRKHVGIWPLPIMEINQRGCVPWSTFAKKNTWKAFF